MEKRKEWAGIFWWKIPGAAGEGSAVLILPAACEKNFPMMARDDRNEGGAALVQ
jgi:hypothetical protein